MYNAHRGLVQPQHGERFMDLLDNLRLEWENEKRRNAGEVEQHRDGMIRQQIHEMDIMRDKVAQLDLSYQQMKQEYEKKIEQLQRDLEMRGGPPHGAPHHPPQPQPPSIGHGPRDLFGGIMQGGGGQGQSSLAPPPQEPQQPQGMPPHLTQNSGLSTGPQPPGHQPYPYPGNGVNGFGGGPQPPPINQSPGPNKGRGRGLPGTSTPQQSNPVPYSPRGHGPTPPPGARGPPPPPPQSYPIPDVGNELSKLNVEDLPPHLKKHGEDWWAIFNPRVPRKLDINLMHTLSHNSVVCCVRFSADGSYIATGCNRMAQIFDVRSGQCVTTLEDETSDKEGDLYIRSVCFSPDGALLATGAEDKCIRVWDISRRTIVHTFTGHEQDIYSLDFSRDSMLIASGSGDRTVRLWDMRTRKMSLEMQIEEGVTTVALSPDGRLVAAGSLDRSVRVWETDTGAAIDNLDGMPNGKEQVGGHGDSVYSVSFSPNGYELVSGSLDKTIKLWALETQRSGNSGQSKLTSRCVRTFEGHSDFVLSVAFSPDNLWVLSGSKDRGVVFWDRNTGIPQLHLQGHRNSVISVAPSPQPDVGIFATGSGDSRARIWRYVNIA
ncbi:MAG: hypothetical protein Q9159_007244 [Coniocarpon cinnabarinum]